MGRNETLDSGEVLVPASHLRRFACSVFSQLGMTPEHAYLMADQITWAHLRGHSSLGARKIIQYGTRVLNGGTSAVGESEVIVETTAFVLLDAHHTFSQVAGVDAMRKAVAMAGSVGTGVAVLRNTTSAGALGYFAEIAAKDGMIGMAINNGPALLHPWGGKTKLFGNQAFAIASPSGNFDDVILDTALGEMTHVGMHGYQERGETLPEGVALDASGRPTVDPAEAIAGIMVPMGGHRGYGLAVMWEVLTGVLAGGGRFIDDITMPDVFDRPQGVSMFFLAINPQICMPLDTFAARVDQLIDRIHASPPAQGVERVLFPGERSAERARHRSRNGIPLPSSLIAELEAFGAELGVPWN